MVENGYLAYERSIHDRRSVRVRLTEMGRQLRDRVADMHRRHVEALKATSAEEADLETAAVTLRCLERFWTNAEDLAARGPLVGA